VIRVIRRLGVKVMDCLSAILPTALTRLAIAHDPDFAMECSDATSLGGWVPTKYNDSEARLRFDSSMSEWRQVVTKVYAVAVETAGPADQEEPELQDLRGLPDSCKSLRGYRR
jgi:hypothetical protein